MRIEQKLDKSTFLMIYTYTGCPRFFFSEPLLMEQMKFPKNQIIYIVFNLLHGVDETSLVSKTFFSGWLLESYESFLFVFQP